MTIDTRAEVAAPACTKFSSLYQHPLLEDGTAGHTLDERRAQQSMQRQAENICLGCPIMTQCLYQAVVEHDVAGYVAGTTERQRQQMRQKLGVRVVAEDLDTLAGVTTPNRQVNHDEVVRLRNANPTESLEQIAHRLGCSLSTVKRHLRRERRGEVARPLASVRPSIEQVLHVFGLVTRPATRRPTSPSRAA